MSNLLLAHVFWMALASTSDLNPPSPASNGVVPTEFKHDDNRLGRKLVVALGFVGFVATCAFALVRLQRDGKLRFIAPPVAAPDSIRVLGFKRVSGKLIVVTLKLPGGTVVTLAENGHSISLLNRVEPTVGSAATSSEDDDEA